jgi:predicted nucleotide-binding protein (sugar kinase/HSP70/actin superfamily)
VVTLATNLRSFNNQPGFKFDAKEYAYKASIGMMFTDALSSIYHSTVIREKNKGDAQATAECYLNDLMAGAIRMTKTGLLEALQRAVRDFNAIPTTPGLRPPRWNRR